MIAGYHEMEVRNQVIRYKTGCRGYRTACFNLSIEVSITTEDQLLSVQSQLRCRSTARS